MLRKTRICVATALLGLFVIASLQVRSHAAKIMGTSTSSRLFFDPGYRTLSLDETCDSIFNQYLEMDGDLSVKEEIQGARHYANCFITRRASITIEKQRLKEIEQRIFPYLKPRMPWNPASNQPRQGIAISLLDEEGVGETVQLVSVLHYLGTELPIQIVSNGPIDEDEKKRISRAAPNLDVTFLDASGFISEGHEDNFGGYADKWLALLFTRFSEVILMDSDIVPFEDPAQWFLSDQYLGTGAYFFRDRIISRQVFSPSEQNLYADLLPSRNERISFRLPMAGADDAIFDKSILKNQMDSRVVVLDRTRHITGAIVGMTMQMREETSRPVVGNKELMWLGQLVAGNTDFAFNKLNPGAIGHVITTDYAGEDEEGEVKKDRSHESYEIHSSHTAQFDTDMNLKWMSGGLLNCRHDYAEQDWESVKALQKHFDSPEKLNNWYKEVIDIDGAVVPASDHTNMWLSAVSAWDGWSQDKERGCLGYYWKAEDIPGHRGTTKKFGDKDLAHIKGVVKAWSLKP